VVIACVAFEVSQPTLECLRCACVAPIALISGSAVPAAYRRTLYGAILVLITVVP